MQTRVSSSPPLARSDTTDFLALRRPRAPAAPAPSDMTPAATAAAPGALTFGVALGALEEALEALVTRLTAELGAWPLRCDVVVGVVSVLLFLEKQEQKSGDTWLILMFNRATVK